VLNDAFKTGLSFGLTSGIITTLGLIVGLHSGTHSKVVVIGGILTIAIADSFSDALGIHISQESQRRHSTRAIWESTFATFAAKFVFALTFVVPLLLLPIESAIIASVTWGLLLLAGFNVYMAREQGVSPWGMVFEHVLIALVVVAITYYVGGWIGEIFKDGPAASQAASRRWADLTLL
jgi:VIT1/CCC1 family predicted Fe2+/Mn2+ transporter